MDEQLIEVGNRAPAVEVKAVADNTAAAIIDVILLILVIVNLLNCREIFIP